MWIVVGSFSMAVAIFRAFYVVEKLTRVWKLSPSEIERDRSCEGLCLVAVVCCLLCFFFPLLFLMVFFFLPQTPLEIQGDILARAVSFSLSCFDRQRRRHSQLKSDVTRSGQP